MPRLSTDCIVDLITYDFVRPDTIMTFLGPVAQTLVKANRPLHVLLLRRRRPVSVNRLSCNRHL